MSARTGRRRRGPDAACGELEAAAAAAADVSHLMGPSAAAALADQDEPILVPEDPLGDVDRYDDGAVLFDLPGSGTGGMAAYADERWTAGMADDKRALAGGYPVPTFWELCVRSAVQGLFAPPPSAPPAPDDAAMAT